METPIQMIVFRGERSKEIAEMLKSKENVPIFFEDDSFGLDKNKCLFIFDKQTKKKKREMINQSLKNKGQYPYSIAILNNKRKQSIIRQIHSDYFTNFHRNIIQWGFPWGLIGKKEQEKNNLIFLESANDKMIKEFAYLLKKFGVLGIEKTNSQEMIAWLNNAKLITVNLFAMVCPDYSFSQDTNNNILRYTEENKLREGIGLVAIKTIDFLEQFSQIIRSFKLNICLTIGIADYEDYAENLQRLNESKDSFDKKIKKSIQSIEEECKKREIEAKVIAIRSYFGDAAWEEAWRNSKEEIQIGINSLEKNKIDTLIRDRKELYSKWIKDIKDAEVLERIINQGTEYTTCGFLFSKKFENLLILGTNSINMEFFYKLRTKNLPVLYVTRVHR